MISGVFEVPLAPALGTWVFSFSFGIRLVSVGIWLVVDLRLAISLRFFCDDYVASSPQIEIGSPLGWYVKYFTFDAGIN